MLKARLRIIVAMAECLDHMLFRTAADLELKLGEFREEDYNRYRTHSQNGQTPITTPKLKNVDFKNYQWQSHCGGLYQTCIKRQLQLECEFALHTSTVFN